MSEVVVHRLLSSSESEEDGQSAVSKDSDSSFSNGHDTSDDGEESGESESGDEGDDDDEDAMLALLLQARTQTDLNYDFEPSGRLSLCQFVDFIRALKLRHGPREYE